jgi:hypothetical protein
LLLHFFIFACLSLLPCLIVSFPGALKAAHARIASLEASRTAFDAATAAKVNAEKSSKSALAKVKKAEKDLGISKKEHLQREQAVAERLNQTSAAAGGTYYTLFLF